MATSFGVARASRRDRVRQMWCELGDVSVYYETRGTGRPVVFLHGWSWDHRIEMADFEPIFGRRPGWLRIYPDLPGSGRTRGHERIEDQDAILDVVARFLDEVVGAAPLVLVGTSAGAYLARGVVSARAAAIDGLLLRVPLIIPDDRQRTVAKFTPLLADPDLIAALGDDAHTLGDVLVQRAGYVDALRAKQRSLIGPSELESDTAHLASIRDDPARYALSFDVDALAQPFDRPTLIIAGRQDTEVGYQDAWRILENYPRASFVVLDRAEHRWPIDEHALFDALVGEWLARVDEASS